MHKHQKYSRTLKYVVHEAAHPRTARQIGDTKNVL